MLPNGKLISTANSTRLAMPGSQRTFLWLCVTLRQPDVVHTSKQSTRSHLASTRSRSLPMTSVTPQWIDNAPYESSHTTSLSHPNDRTLPTSTVHSASEKDVEKAIASAHAAFPAWAATPAVERREILLRAAGILRTRKDEFVQAWQSQMDVEEGFASFNVMTSAAMIEEVAAGITLAMAGDIPTTKTCEFSPKRRNGACY